ncbi:MAG: sugar transferase [Anaerolineae bacterium]
MHQQSTSAESLSETHTTRVAPPGPRHILARHLLDLFILLGSLLLARWLRLALPIGKPLDAEGVALYPLMVALAVFVWSVSLTAARAYSGARHRDTIDELQAIASAVTVATLVYAGLLYLSYRGLSRLLYGYFYLLDLGLTVVARLLWRRYDRRHGLDCRRIALLGTSPEAQQLASALTRQGGARVRVLGLISEGCESAPLTAGAPPVLGELCDLAALIAAQSIEELVLGAARPAAEMEELLHTLQSLPVALTLVPDTTQLVLSRAQIEPLGDLVLIALNAPVIGPLDRSLKRALDIVLATLALLLLSPLLTLVALAIVLDSGRPVLYRSRRLGEGEQAFEMFKFRTMVADADRAQDTLITADGAGRLDFAKRPDDPRVTRVGRVLRRWSIDELPQLLNVLRGEMSLVGPRPEIPELAAHYAPWQRRRFSVPQGITGWWQVSGRSDLPRSAHVEDDLIYIRNYSLSLDLQILWRTVGAVLRGRGAY